MVDQPRYRERDRDRDRGWDREAYGPGLEQRLDQWMTAGRQLVDGVAGARPGSRPSARAAGSRAGSRLRPADLGRWVETKLDWLLDDEESWREPWQEQQAAAAPPQFVPQTAPQTAAPRRRPLEAVSRRGTPLLRQAPAVADQADWPDDTSFSVNRWRREPGPAPEPVPPAASPSPGRAVPRSSRRRSG